VKKIALLIATATALAACGGSGQVVATVDGVEITMSEVEALSSSGSGTVSREVFLEDLRNAIVEVMVLKAAEDEFGISYGEEEIDAKLEEIKRDIELQTGLTFEDFLESEGFSEERIRRIAHQQLVAEVLQERLAEQSGEIGQDEIQEAYDSRLFEFTEACVSHILVATEEEADAIKERVDGGEDFGALAAELSIDPSAVDNSGDLGCSPLARYVTEFSVAASEAPIGEVTEPVESQFGFHLIRVDSREVTPIDDVSDLLAAEISSARSSELFSEWLLDLVADTEVTVDPEYGTWATDPVPQVLPPG